MDVAGAKAKLARGRDSAQALENSDADGGCWIASIGYGKYLDLSEVVSGQHFTFHDVIPIRLIHIHHEAGS